MRRRCGRIVLLLRTARSFSGLYPVERTRSAFYPAEATSRSFESGQAEKNRRFLHVGASLEAWETGDDDHGEEDFETITQPTDEEDAALLKEHLRWSQAVETATKNLQKKEASLQRELEKAQKVENYETRANLIKNNLYLLKGKGSTAKVQNWETGECFELTLDSSYESAVAEVEALFQYVRRLKRGSNVVQDLVASTAQAVKVLQELQRDLSEANVNGNINEDQLRLVQDRLVRSAGTTSFSPPLTESEASLLFPQNASRNKKPALGTPASNTRMLVTPAGTNILVGRNQRGNEYLSLNVAKGDDVWMHARGIPGAHVVLQGRSVTDECIQMAANLASFYSDGRSETKVWVTATAAKHLTKPRGAPMGAVAMKKELFTRLGFPQDVPAELKDARAESGRSDEYRAADKAKLRKQTQARQKKAKAKSKQK